MSRIEQLPEVTEQVLSGLQAGDELKSRIYRKALEPDSRPSRGSMRIPMIALCSLSVVMIALHVRVVLQGAGKQRLHNFVAAAGNAAVKLDAGFFKR